MMRYIILVIAGLMLWVAPAAAQQEVYLCNPFYSSQGTLNCPIVSSTNPFPVTPGIGPSPSIGITSVVSASAEASHVLKAIPGNLYGAYATNLTATPGFLVLINATSTPADGAITPLACVPLPANGMASINNKPGPPQVYSTGIVAVVTSATTCFTKTTGVITAYLSGDVQ